MGRSDSRRVASPSYSDYLARGVSILEALVPVLEKIFDAHFRGKDALEHLFETLNSLNDETEALTPPAVSPLEVSGAGSGDANKAVTKFQNLLHSASVNLITRFAKLSEQAGAYIAWLGGLIADVDTATAEEPWQLIGDGCPHMLEAFMARDRGFWRKRGQSGQSSHAGKPEGLSG